MAASSDVRDILELNIPAADAGISLESIMNWDKKKTQKKRPSDVVKKPEGMARELYALLYSDKSREVPPLMPTDSPAKLGGYKNMKAKLGMRTARSWKWSGFTNPARSDGLMLSHWVKEGDEEKEYPFAAFNRVLSVPEFTADEFEEHLKLDGWSYDETLHLFQLCAKFDLRWPVIQDRWDRERFSGKRTVEDLKERYYDSCNTLAQARESGRPEDVQLLNFDAGHERKRKEQLEKLWNRSQDQIDEEEYLIGELKKIEARRKERERKAQDLQKLITAADVPDRGMGGVGGSGGFGSSTNLTGTSLDKKKKIVNPIKRFDSVSSLDANIGITGIRWPESKGPGVTMRSQRMKIPGNLGQKKSKALEQLLQELLIELNPIPTEEICDEFNMLRSDLLLLYELRATLATCQFELESDRHQYAALTGQNLEIPLRLRPPVVDDLPSLNLDSLATSLPPAAGAASTSATVTTAGSTPSDTLPAGCSSIKRRLNEILELTSHRRRRTVVEQSPIVKKLRKT